jgi:HEAT repeat protein
VEGSPRGAILFALEHPDWGVQWAGLLAIQRYGPSDEALGEAVGRALGSDMEAVRRTAAEAAAYLGRAELASVFAGLQGLSADPVPGVRAAAIRTLARRSPDHVALVPLFERALADTDADARSAGAYGLAQIELQEKLPPDVVARLRPVLVKALGDEVTDVVVYAVMALGRAGPQATGDVPAILALLDDKRALVRGQAATALGSIGEAALPQLETALSEGVGRRLAPLLWALRQMGAPAYPVLRRALEHESGIVRALAAQKLWEQEQDIERSVDILIAVLQQGEPDPVRVAVRTLGRMGTEGARALPALRTHAEHPDEKIRAAVLATIAHLEARDG